MPSEHAQPSWLFCPSSCLSDQTAPHAHGHWNGDDRLKPHESGTLVLLCQPGVGGPTRKRAGASADYLRIPAACSKMRSPRPANRPRGLRLPARVNASFWAGSVVGGDAAICPCGPGSAHPGHESASSRAHGALSGRSRPGSDSCAVPGCQPACGRPRCTSDVPPATPLMYLFGTGAVTVAGMVIKLHKAHKQALCSSNTRLRARSARSPAAGRR
jgi:hypothetical protein